LRSGHMPNASARSASRRSLGSSKNIPVPNTSVRATMIQNRESIDPTYLSERYADWNACSHVVDLTLT